MKLTYGSESMRIVKIPDKFDIDRIVSERIDKVYQKCPFCYEEAINKTHDEKNADEFAREYVCKEIEAGVNGEFYRKFISKEEYVYSFESPSSFSCYSKTKPIEKGLFKKRYYFVHKQYKCNRCKAEWCSEDYPLGLNEDILDKLNKNKQSNNDALRDLENLIGEDIAPTTFTLPMKEQY